MVSLCILAWVAQWLKEMLTEQKSPRFKSYRQVLIVRSVMLCSDLLGYGITCLGIENGGYLAVR